MKEGIRHPGIFRQSDWRSSLTFFAKQEPKLIEDWLGIMLPLKRYSY